MIQQNTNGQHKYRHSISLGYNCEIAFNFWRTQKCLESSLFSWTSSSPQTLANAISHLDMLGSQGFSVLFPTGGIYQENITHVGFHGRLSNTLEATPSQLKECEEELCSRVRYLAEKFQRIAKEEEDVIYFYKYKDCGETVGKMIENIKNIYNALSGLHTFPFTLVVVCEESCALAKASIPDMNVHIRTVKYFTNDACVTESEWDKPGWECIFAEFPHQSNPLPAWFKTKLFIKKHGKKGRGIRRLCTHVGRFFTRLFGNKAQ